jgi:hypothetical protein
VTGTVVASSADDGRLRLRRQDLSGQWALVSEVDTAAAEVGQIAARAPWGGGVAATAVR